jgi:DNA replication protein DnaC
MEVIEDRHGRRATLIASQLPTELWHEYISEATLAELWHEYISEATLADAILDRLLHGAHRIPLAGESMRKCSAPLTDRDRSK